MYDNSLCVSVYVYDLMTDAIKKLHSRKQTGKYPNFLVDIPKC